MTSQNEQAAAAHASTELSFPRLSARTQRFTLGAPRAITIAPDGRRLAFLRSRGGTDRVTCLWTHDVDTGEERLVADPFPLLGLDTSGSAPDEQLSREERARRERTREGAGGIVGYATDTEMRTASFALSGRLFVADLVAGSARELPAAGSVVDPRPDPTGRRVAYASGGRLHLVDVDGTRTVALCEPDLPEVTWGLAEFVAAEEMDRHRGFWWAPDGESLLVARVDESPVQRWWISDPEHPERHPAEVAYPAAGTPNADVRLFHVTLDGERREVVWDRDELPYLAAVGWSTHGRPLVLLQSRDQKVQRTLAVNPGGPERPEPAVELVDEATDPAWVELVPGLPAWSADGRLLHAKDELDTRRLYADDEPLTPDGLQVSAVLDVLDDAVLFAASSDPTETHLWLARGNDELVLLTDTAGVHTGRAVDSLLVRASATLDTSGTTYTLHELVPEGLGRRLGALQSRAATAPLVPNLEMLTVGERAIRTTLLLPTGWTPDDGALPVLLDPYGGPGAARVRAARNAHVAAQWFADQGFAVIIADGRGTPGRGPAWERAIHLDVAAPVLEDQVAALHGVAAARPGTLDLTKVGIRGWSFGGYLAALAVLRRPDVFHAAVAGAPVTDWRLYDTHYTERYLGTPQEQPEAYARSSIVADAAALERPLLLIHGLADDNVVAAHTLTLSSALLAAGRPHTVLPLSGVTHMTPQEVVAENLLLLQVQYLKQALGVG